MSQKAGSMKLAKLIFVGMLLHLTATLAKRVKISVSFDDNQDSYLWRKSGKFQGDIILTAEQEILLQKIGENRNGVVDTRLRWPNREIPYEISSDFTSAERDYIAAVLKEDYARTCFRVVPRKNEPDYVYVTGQNTGCWSYVGRFGGRQELNLQRNGCLYYATIVHEFLHAAGFYHMQCATERDDYVTIQWANIQSGQEHNFDKYGSNVITSFGQRYDYGSLLHYDEYAFSKNGQKTIIPKENVEIGKAPRLSSIDIIKLNKMYGCNMFKPIIKN